MPTYEGVWRPLDILTRLPRRLYSVNHVGRKDSHGGLGGHGAAESLPTMSEAAGAVGYNNAPD